MYLGVSTIFIIAALSQQDPLPSVLFAIGAASFVFFGCVHLLKAIKDIFGESRITKV
jgi:hypothetical protein